MEEKSCVTDQEIADLAGRIARNAIAPGALERDRQRTFPKAEMSVLGDAALLGLGVPAAYGGIQTGRTGLVSGVTEIAKACGSTALVYVSHLIATKAVADFAQEPLKEELLPDLTRGRLLGAFAVHESDSGSNAGAISTVATRNGEHYFVNGSKFLITSAGEAQKYLVLVRTDPGKGPRGMSTLMIDRNAAGLSFGGIEDKMGLTSTSSRSVFFDDCRVPAGNLVGAEGKGLQVLAGAVVGWGLFGAAAISVGIGTCAAGLAARHGKDRMISGGPIGAYQAVQALISDMIVQSEAAQAFLLTCAMRADSTPDRAALEAQKAKLFASEMAVDVANKSLQVVGGHGYCRDYQVERLVRDARGLTLHFKTSEWLRQDIAKSTLQL